MELKMDLTKKGLEMFFNDYQLKSLQVLWMSETGLFSRDVWIQVNQRRSESISRASIINFLNAMLEIGVLSGTIFTGKGGHRTRYGAKMGEEKLKNHLKKMVKEKLKTMT